MTTRGDSGGASRTIKELAAIDRNRGKEQLRVSWDEYQPTDGQPSRYVSIRVWYQTDSGEWRPTKTGCTVRRAELETVHAALGKVLDGLRQQNGFSS
jgi:hypothetical protein